MIRSTTRRIEDIEGLLFDLDGTLLDTLELILSSFRYATRTILGEALPDEMLLRDMGRPLAAQLHDIAPEHAEALLKTYREHNALHHDAMASAFPGAAGVIAQLAAIGLPMGVVTSKGAPMAIRGLEVFGLRTHFGVVVTADDVPIHKPDPFPLRYAASALGVSLANCAYVGDSPHDIVAARAGGAIAVAALWGAFPAEQVLAAQPHYAIGSIGELPGLLGYESLSGGPEDTDADTRVSS